MQQPLISTFFASTSSLWIHSERPCYRKTLFALKSAATKCLAGNGPVRSERKVGGIVITGIVIGKHIGCGSLTVEILARVVALCAHMRSIVVVTETDTSNFKGNESKGNGVRNAQERKVFCTVLRLQLTQTEYIPFLNKDKII